MFWIQVSFRCKGVGGSGCVQMGERDRRKGVMTLSLTNRGGSGSWYPIMDRSVTLLSVLVFQGEGGSIANGIAGGGIVEIRERG